MYCQNRLVIITQCCKTGNLRSTLVMFDISRLFELGLNIVILLLNIFK